MIKRYIEGGERVFMHFDAVFTSILVALVPISAFGDGRLDPVRTTFQTPKTLNATFKQVSSKANQRSLGSECPQEVVALTDSDFGNGTYILQAGFAEGESFGATFSVPASNFPIKVDVMEALFGTSNAVISTTTHWSVTIWDGTPTNGIQVASFSSDDLIIPHLTMPPGTNGIIVSVSVDPNDPDQIYIYNDSGLNSYTVAFRIDQHNTPGSPCLSAPDQNRNAFPCTDIGGLHFPNENWIDAIDGPWCICGAGWMTFQQFPSICTPSGDWVIRSAYTPVNCSVAPAACCFSDTTCQDLSPGDCDVFGGISQNPGTTCATFVCGSGIGACCLESTGNCVNFDLNNCTVVGGIHMGEGTSCASTTCFPVGACCLADGACIGPIAIADCQIVAGTFQGDGTSCATASCPQPVGACCGADWCLDLTQADCSAVAGSWQGNSSICSATSCDVACPADIDSNGVVDVNDLLSIVGAWGSNDPALDLDGNGVVDTPDLLTIIAAWGNCG